MDSDVCKLKQILEHNSADFSETFSQFLLSDPQNLKQLSKLINELEKVKIASPCLNKINEADSLDNASATESQHKTISSDKPQVTVQNNVQEQACLNQQTGTNQHARVDEQVNLDESIQQSYVVPLVNVDQLDTSSENINSVGAISDTQNITLDLHTTLELAPILHVEQQIVVDQAEKMSAFTTEPNLENKLTIDAKNISSTPEIISSETEKNRLEIESVFRRSKYEDIKFQVENARVGQHYQSRISVISQHDVNQLIFKPESFKFPDTSFYFDEATQRIHGEPQLADSIEFSFQFIADGETRSAQCRLNVIADPRSLWKVIEPECGQKFSKPHLDQALIDAVDYKIIAASRRGRSHEHAGLFRDDDFSITLIENTPWSVLTVADGAGSAQYSREGSRIAVEIVENNLKNYLNPQTVESLISDLEKWQVGSQDAETVEVAKKLNEQFHHVYYEIYKSIINQIRLQAEQIEANTKDFSTTLLVAVVCKLADKTFISAFSVGDGAIAVYSDNNVRLMNVPDGGEYAGQTKFLDLSIATEFPNRLKIGCFKDTNAIMLMTDGISDPKFETDSGLSNFDKWQSLYRELDPLLQNEAADTALLEWMHFFTAGHHDDRTMAVLWNKHSTTSV
ncbi:protein phosphatase 2C domain-containing protein [Acinetobacter sp. ULE_I057]|uniref:protein phosphatase 2C domain-containing protein n=1 Tax=Acinetobacter sp. ULE_I057 TaxID=3373070 RepID=UPI003AF568A4